MNPARLWRRVLEFPPLVGLGRISYGLYLVHVPLIYWLAGSKVGAAYPVATVGVAGASVVVALVSYCLVERPFFRLKARLRHDVDGKSAPAEPGPIKRAA